MAPAVGIIKPGNTAEISIHHDDTNATEDDVGAQYWHSEDTRDNLVILSVVIRGSKSTETRSHQCHVRHCYSPKNTAQNESSTKGGSKRHQSTHQRASAKYNDKLDDNHRSRHEQ